MELNFGVDVSNLKDWLDVDSHTATEIIEEFCKARKINDSATKVYAFHEFMFVCPRSRDTCAENFPSRN